MLYILEFDSCPMLSAAVMKIPWKPSPSLSAVEGKNNMSNRDKTIALTFFSSCGKTTANNAAYSLYFGDVARSVNRGISGPGD
jgi:hypothetical protein